MTEVKYFRKKPVVVEAVQFNLGSTTKAELLRFCSFANVGAPANDDSDIRWVVIPTLEGDMEARDGDWIVRGTRGEFYLVKEGPFEDTFEPVDG